MKPPTTQRFLDKHRIPELIRLDAHFDANTEPAQRSPWPPRPGYCLNPDLGITRIWTSLDLAAWLDHAPQAFGPHSPGELPQLATTGAKLRRAGEGTRVLWALDVVTAHQWVSHPDTALAVSELVCIGPRLTNSLISAIDTALNKARWTHSCPDPNQPCTINHVACFETSWHHSEMSSSRHGQLTEN